MSSIRNVSGRTFAVGLRRLQGVKLRLQNCEGTGNSRVSKSSYKTELRLVTNRVTNSDFLILL